MSMGFGMSILAAIVLLYVIKKAIYGNLTKIV
jgi:hypothetical protein